jgi:transposase-like protein
MAYRRTVCKNERWGNKKGEAGIAYLSNVMDR